MLSRALFIVAVVSAHSIIAQRTQLDQVLNLITFGDSYTDEGRLGAYIANNGKVPPPGTYIPISNVTASGGYSWPYYASQLLGAKLYDYAISGATCSNEIISRYFASINRSFPSVVDDEIPAFQADTQYSSLYPYRTPSNTVYTLWIGTNDLGFGGFLSDSSRPGTTITDFVECIWSALDKIYATEHGGVGNNEYWANKTSYNTTEIEYKILEYTTMTNTMFDYGAPFQSLVKSRWPHASITIYNVHQLITDIYNNGPKYLDAPANVNDPYKSCPTSTTCTESTNLMSSFLWFDELHPSAKTDEIIGTEFVKVLQGNSIYGTYY